MASHANCLCASRCVCTALRPLPKPPGLIYFITTYNRPLHLQFEVGVSFFLRKSRGRSRQEKEQDKWCSLLHWISIWTTPTHSKREQQSAATKSREREREVRTRTTRVGWNVCVLYTHTCICASSCWVMGCLRITGFLRASIGFLLHRRRRRRCRLHDYGGGGDVGRSIPPSPPPPSFRSMRARSPCVCVCRVYLLLSPDEELSSSQLNRNLRVCAWYQQHGNLHLST